MGVGFSWYWFSMMVLLPPQLRTLHKILLNFTNISWSLIREFHRHRAKGQRKFPLSCACVCLENSFTKKLNARLCFYTYEWFTVIISVQPGVDLFTLLKQACFSLDSSIGMHDTSSIRPCMLALFLCRDLEGIEGGYIRVCFYPCDIMTIRTLLISWIIHSWIQTSVITHK